MLPPQFMVEFETGVALSEPLKQCLFCKDEILSITINTAAGKSEKYTKEQAKKEYQMFLNMLKEKTEQMKKLGGKVGFEPKTLI